MSTTLAERRGVCEKERHCEREAACLRRSERMGDVRVASDVACEDAHSRCATAHDGRRRDMESLLATHSWRVRGGLLLGILPRRELQAVLLNAHSSCADLRLLLVERMARLSKSPKSVRHLGGSSSALPSTRRS